MFFEGSWGGIVLHKKLVKVVSNVADEGFAF